MSSGLQRLYRRFRTLWGGSNRRTDRLAARSQTVFLHDVVEEPSPPVVVVDLGFGTECWVVPRESEVRITADLEAIEGGRLILETPGRPAPPGALEERGVSPRPLPLRL